jgi:hypothetical protein
VPLLESGQGTALTLASKPVRRFVPLPVSPKCLIYAVSSLTGDPNLPTFVGSDRIALEEHPYFAFDGKGSLDVVPYIPAPCQAWGPMMNKSQKSFGVTTGGEFSLGFNDCMTCSSAYAIGYDIDPFRYRRPDVSLRFGSACHQELY